MAQSSTVINGGQSGLGFTNDLNAGLSALVTQNSGSSAPTTTYAYMMWADTSASVMKIRNAANTAWVTLYKLDSPLLNRDMSQNYISDTSAVPNTVTVAPAPAHTAYVAGMTLFIKVAVTNTGSTNLNVNGLGTKSIKKIDGATNLVAGDIVAGQLIAVTYDGTNFQLLTPPGTPATIADGSIALSKMAAQNAGSLISYNSSNTPTLVSAGTAGQILKSNGTGALPSWSTLLLGGMFANVDGTSPTNGQILRFNSASGKYEPYTPASGLVGIRGFTSSGTYTPTAGVSKIIVFCAGGGSYGGTGGTSSFGSVCSATGGTAAGTTSWQNNPSGVSAGGNGTATGGDLNLSGGGAVGRSGINYSFSTSSNGALMQSLGGGGGAGGLAIKYISSLLSSYAITVGAGNGYILIYEFA